MTEARSDHDTEWSAIRLVASRLGVGPETVRKWVRQGEINVGLLQGMAGSENVEIRRLKVDVAELKRTAEILRTASVFLRPSSADPLRDDLISRCVS